MFRGTFRGNVENKENVLPNQKDENKEKSSETVINDLETVTKEFGNYKKYHYEFKKTA
jgi:hypothetical protein